MIELLVAKIKLGVAEYGRNILPGNEPTQTTINKLLLSCELSLANK
jgi:hypothetical protein